jgi:stage II sporulation protein D
MADPIPDPRRAEGARRSSSSRTCLRFLLLAASAVAAACTIPEPRSPDSGGVVAPPSVLVRVAGRVESVRLEDYVLAAALSEVTPLNETPETVQRIYEVQAVLARTYAISHLGRHRADGFDLCDTTHCQLYEPGRLRTSRFASAARTAVSRTAGVVLTYAQRPIEALYHADCGGYTAAADAVWGGPPVPYLLPAPDQVPATPHRSWKLSIPATELRSALNADARSRVGRRLNNIQIAQQDVSGRATQIVVTGEERHEVRGEELRAIVDQRLGDRAIQSTRFSITRVGDSYVFQGTGFGHGVGLCQFGAAARARNGESLDHILAAYFRGARVSRTHVIGN